VRNTDSKSFIRGVAFFRNSVSIPNTIAYGNVLFTKRGSLLKKNSNCFSSHASINLEYQITWEASFSHSGFSLIFESFFDKSPYSIGVINNQI